MALSPEDVLKKTFTTTQFRKGYDEHEVDEFLDDIVAAMRRLSSEKDDLRGQLNEIREGKGFEPVLTDDEAATKQNELERLHAHNADLEEQVNNLQGQLDDSAGKIDSLQAKLKDMGDGASREVASGEGGDEQIATVQARIEDAERQAQERIAKAEADAAAAEKAAQERIAAVEGGEEASSTFASPSGAGSAAGVLELAQKLHDEHVAAGQSKRDELITRAQERHDDLISTAQARHDELTSTGQVTHDEMITDARGRATRLVSEAEETKAAVLEQLGRERSSLEQHIDELRGFERDYRVRLKEYIIGQLEELNRTEAGPGSEEFPAEAGASEQEESERHHS